MTATADDTAAFDAQLRHFVGTALFPTMPERIAVAVSGGGDSMALLHVAYEVLHGTDKVLEAVTVDHGLRSDSADEARAVAAYCEGLGINHAILRWDDWDGRGNVMDAARRARIRLIGAWAKGRGIGGVLLGHTADDIAETFLMRLARKSGLDGLAAMDVQFERDGMRWARPLWQQSRADLRNYLRRHEVPWIDDPTNEDDRFDRARTRKALSALTELGIGVEELFHSADALRGARSALTHYTSEAARAHVTIDGGDVLIPRRSRPPIHPEIINRLLVAGLRWVGRGDYPPRWSALVELSAGLSLVGKHTLAGCLVTERDGVIRISREWNAVRATTCPTTGVWDGRWAVDGPHAPGLEVRALGEAVRDCPDWRDTGRPRDSLLSSPAIWDKETLIAAPLAGFNPEWSVRIVADFMSFLHSH
ncbi:tRNA lysidine(34) synthetase TilS [Loktanella sp. IMCC34160]|uniref:tRNA lysidine(34) synthetase TilS n=1 Tax=Loktanella sp. IMCC34160 TaxID=2510646 RepID=UPI001F5C53D5|nr:tRNA lysidine(34) synthetase TilS [Loktanella sp. IMCC34160]